MEIFAKQSCGEAAMRQCRPNGSAGISVSRSANRGFAIGTAPVNDWRRFPFFVPRTSYMIVTVAGSLAAAPVIRIGETGLPYEILEGAPESPRWARPRAARNEAGARSESVQKLFFEHNRALVRFLATKLNSEAEALDVAQEAYVRLLQLDQPDAIGFLRTYLFRVAENIANDHLRHRAVHERSQPTQHMLFEQLLNRPGPDRSAIGQEELQIVRRALRELPAKCRKAFVLHVFAERSLAEIAVEMQLSDRMIRYYVARALAHCSAALDMT